MPNVPSTSYWDCCAHYLKVWFDRDALSTSDILHKVCRQAITLAWNMLQQSIRFEIFVLFVSEQLQLFELQILAINIPKFWLSNKSAHERRRRKAWLKALTYQWGQNWHASSQSLLVQRLERRCQPSHAPPFRAVRFAPSEKFFQTRERATCLPYFLSPKTSERISKSLQFQQQRNSGQESTCVMTLVLSCASLACKKTRERDLFIFSFPSRLSHHNFIVEWGSNTTNAKTEFQIAAFRFHRPIDRAIHTSQKTKNRTCWREA